MFADVLSCCSHLTWCSRDFCGSFLGLFRRHINARFQLMVFMANISLQAKSPQYPAERSWRQLVHSGAEQLRSHSNETIMNEVCMSSAACQRAENVDSLRLISLSPVSSFSLFFSFSLPAPSLSLYLSRSLAGLLRVEGDRPGLWLGRWCYHR